MGLLATLAKDHHLIAFDVRGHGKSGHPHDRKAYGKQLGQDIVRLLEHLKISRAHIVGFSMGGNIVATLLTTNPQHFITATLVGASGRRDWSPQRERDAEAAAVELEHGVPYRSLLLSTWPSDQPPPSDEAIREFSRRKTMQNDPLAHAAMQRARRDEVVTDAALAAVQVPTLAVVGTADSNITGVKSLKAAWPALQVVVVDGATHWGDRGVLTRPEFINALRQFMAAHPGTASK